MLTHEYFFYAIVAAICIGVYYARAAVSIGTAVLGIIAVLFILSPGGLQKFRKSLWCLALTSVILVFALSGINSANTTQWLERLGDNLPFLAIPAGILAFGPLKCIQWVRAMGIFVGATLLSSVLVMGDYALHLEEYNALYKVGKTIPTPIIHVRYSFFLALGAVVAAGLVLDRKVLIRAWRVVFGVTALWLVVCVHILAVRTGILALYGAIVVLAVAQAVRSRRIRPLVITGVAMVILIGGSLVFLPSVTNKIGYVLHDLNMLRTEGVSPEYSDNIRLISIKHGLRLFIEHPIAGVGIGDVEDQMEIQYETRTPVIPAERRFPPISQYVFWLAAFGTVGTVLLIWLLIYPLRGRYRESLLLLGIYALTAFSFIAETTIQLQLGKTVFVLLVAIAMVGLENADPEEDLS